MLLVSPPTVIGALCIGIGALLLLALSQVFSRGIELREDVEGLV